VSTESNIAIARKAYADFGKGDIASILAVLDDQVEWKSFGEEGPIATMHGKQGVARFFQLVAERWSFLAFEPREYIASGDRLAVVGHYTANSKQTGRQFDADWVMLWGFRNGKVTHFQEFTDTLAAMEAVAPHSASA
jgi:ketosteroid isomerase-like protein